MKPVWQDGVLRVELHKPDVKILEKALEVAESLAAMQQPAGAALVEAINAVLKPDQPFEDD